MKNILIVHPEDSTTAFLSKIYEDLGIEHNVHLYTYINEENIPFGEDYDITIFIGHGNKDGLYDTNTKSVLVDEAIYQYLKSKVNIHLWCYSDIFLSKNNINGLCIGQLITDMNEVNTVFTPSISELHSFNAQLNFSNFMLVFILKRLIENTIYQSKMDNNLLKYLINNYYNYKNNIVIKHNQDKIKIVTTLI